MARGAIESVRESPKHGESVIACTSGARGGPLHIGAVFHFLRKKLLVVADHECEAGVDSRVICCSTESWRVASDVQDFPLGIEDHTRWKKPSPPKDSGAPSAQLSFQGQEMFECRSM